MHYASRGIRQAVPVPAHFLPDSARGRRHALESGDRRLESVAEHGRKMAAPLGVAARSTGEDIRILPDSLEFLPDRTCSELEDQASSRRRRMLCNIAAHNAHDAHTG
ncbi:hypothetical protein [Pandoraea communis]|uniref:hypothetical protein n=1 Tax=Pandoraea communis TaxID=2508297 RepID=UPI001240B8A8|nr:hypothetical protein [Pandoraea communis]